jgi:DNA-binding beta-propeller fold protein YncE
VANGNSGHVTAYDRNGTQQKLSGSFPGVDVPESIAYNSKNDTLYVVNSALGNHVGVYAYATTGDPKTLSGTFPRLTIPYGIAIKP